MGSLRVRQGKRGVSSGQFGVQFHAASSRRTVLSPAGRGISPNKAIALGDPSLRLKSGYARDDAPKKTIELRA